MSKAAEIILAAFEAQKLDEDERFFFKNTPPAGVTLFTRNIPENYLDLKELVDSIQSTKPSELPPFIIAIDQEGGRVRRIKDPFPNEGPALHLHSEAIDQNALTFIEDYGYKLGTNLRDLGVNVNFAPVLDILTNPKNDAIGDRVFGKDSSSVTLRAGAFLKGQNRSGVKGCLKHFPGQGDADVDTHSDHCEIPLDQETIYKRELEPFKSLSTSCDMIMLSHCVYPAFSGKPASSSKTIIEDLLKGYIGFNGLIVSDDMMMGAIPQDIEAWSEALIDSLMAGVDLLLVCRDINRIMIACERIDKESIKHPTVRKRLEEAAYKVNQLRITL